MSDDFTIEGKVNLDTTSVVGGLADVAFKFDVIRSASLNVFNDLQQGFNKTVGAMAEFGNEINDQKNILGSNSDEMQRLRAAAMATDTEFSSAAQSIKMFSMRVGDTGEAGEKLRARIEEVGVSLTNSDGSARSMTEIFMSLNSVMGGMGNITERNALANDVYGRSWSTVANMIADGETAAKAFAAVTPVSKEKIDAADAMNTKMKLLNEKFQENARLIGGEMMPATEEWMKLINEMLQDGAPLFELFKGLNKLLVDAAHGFKILGIEAETAWNVFTHPTEAGKYLEAGRQKLNNFVQKTLMDETLAKQGFVDENSVWNAETGRWDNPTKASPNNSNGSPSSYNGVPASAPAIDYTTTQYDANGKANTYIGTDATGKAMYSSNPYANNGSTSSGYVGQADISKTSSGMLYDQVGKVWSYAAQNQDQSYQSSPFLSKIRDLAAEAQRITDGFNGQATWQNTSDNQRLARETMSLWDAYSSQKESQAGFTQINYIQGDNAQQVANAIAEATSRALARQLS